MQNDKIYGVIIESKQEGPLVIESSPLSYEEADKKMRHFSKNPDVIRVAMFKMFYVTGNETLIQKEDL